MSDSNNSNNLKQMIITNVITMALSLSTAYIALQSKREEIGSNIYQSTLERMRVQDETISNLQAQITKANVRSPSQSRGQPRGNLAIIPR